MKRVFKTAILVFAVAAMATSFTSCSEDETATPEQQEVIDPSGNAIDGWVRKATDGNAIDGWVRKATEDNSQLMYDGDNTPIIR